MKKVAVTGGLAAGKTTVCRIFSELGAYVVSADEITHKLLSPGTAVGVEVIRLLGPEIISDNILDRRKIAKKVFSHPKLLQSLEEIIHPAVFDEIEKIYQQIRQEGSHPLFIAEIPLLYESKNEQSYDAVIAVTADPEKCRRRFHSPDEFDKRMDRQLKPKEKAEQSHFAIDNSGTLEELKAQVEALYFQLTT